MICQAEIKSSEIEADEWETKKFKSETALKEPPSPQPLTEDNLRLLQGLPVMSHPKNSKMGDDTTETSSTKLSIDSRRLLRINNLLMNDKEASDRYPKIKAKCEELLTQEKHNGMTKEEQDEILNDLPYMMEVIEETFIDLLWPALIPDVRHKKEGSGTDSTAEQGKARLLTAWKVRNQMFDSNCIPVLDPGNDKTLRDFLLPLPKLEVPKPDYCFGLREGAFTPKERFLNHRLREYTSLSNPLYHCFFAVDFKTLDDGWGKCQTQCCLAGAAMIHATEKILKLASPNNEHPLKEDDHLRKQPCMAFTLAVNPVVSELNVHWAEPSGGKGTVYHMYNVRGYLMNRGEELKNLRHDINCILDWGCGDRKTCIRETLAKIKATKNDFMPTPSLSTTSSKDRKKTAADENWERLNQASDESGVWTPD